MSYGPRALKQSSLGIQSYEDQHVYIYRHTGPATNANNTAASTVVVPTLTVNNSPLRAPLLTSVQNLPVLKGLGTFPKFKRNAEGLMVSHKRYYIVKEVNVPQTSTSVRRGNAARRDAAAPAVLHPHREEDREDVWAFLIRCLDDSIMFHFSVDVLEPELADAAGIWREFHERFDTTDIQTAGRYQGKLWSVKLKDGGNAQKHVNRFQRYFNKLTIAGDAPSDKIFAVALLQSLPDQYSTLKSNHFANPLITSHTVKTAIYSQLELLGFPGGETVDSSEDDDDDVSKKSEVKALVSKAFDAKIKDRNAKSNLPKKVCTEHPNSNTHETKECYVLRHRQLESKDKKIEELNRKLRDLQSAKANVAHVSLGQEPGDGSFGWIAVAPTAMVNTPIQGHKFVIDSAATEHMVHTDANLHDVVEINEWIRPEATTAFWPLTKEISRSLALIFKTYSTHLR
ncbi:hypothetical protein QFC24_005392 [Naganishia onofrii]|uniref:Uncharacterized protein n=1 Tax=Naganishia onofrii TaxID=1851511 RepID=A0ACC2X966_9TREE|nr:hypothetical protein QFC24_005392 [Naganishia onofrii]